MSSIVFSWKSLVEENRVWKYSWNSKFSFAVIEYVFCEKLNVQVIFFLNLPAVNPYIIVLVYTGGFTDICDVSHEKMFGSWT